MQRQKRKNLQEKQDAYGLFLLDEAQNEKERDERENFISSITSLKGLPGYESYTFIIDEIGMNPVINNSDLNILKQQLGLVAILMPGKDSGFYQTTIRATQKFKTQVAVSLSRFSSLRGDAKDDRHTFANMKYIYRREEGKTVSERDMLDWREATKDLESKVNFLSRLMYSDITEHSAKIVVQRVLSSLEDRWDVLNDIQRELIINLKSNINNFNKTFDPDLSDPTWKQRAQQLKGEVLSEANVFEKTQPKEKVEIEDKTPEKILLAEQKQAAAEVARLKDIYDSLVGKIITQDERITQSVQEVNDLRGKQNAWIQLLIDANEKAFSNTNRLPHWVRAMPESHGRGLPNLVEKEALHERYRAAEIVLPRLVGESMKKGSEERVYSHEELERYKEDNERMKSHLQNKIIEADKELAFRVKKDAQLEEKVKEGQDQLNHASTEIKKQLKEVRNLLITQRKYILDNAHGEIERVGKNIGQQRAETILKEASTQFSDLEKDLHVAVLKVYGKKNQEQFLSAIKSAVEKNDNTALDKLKRKKFFEFRRTHLKRVAGLNLLLAAAKVDKEIAEQPHDFPKRMNIIFSALKEISANLEDGILQSDTPFVLIRALAQAKYNLIKGQHATHFAAANVDAELEFRGINKERDEHVEKIDRQLEYLDQRQRKLDRPIEAKMAPVAPTFETHSHESDHADVAIATASLFAHAPLHQGLSHSEKPKQTDEEGPHEKLN